MVTLAELVGLPFILLVFVQWWRAEHERTAELDARLDREAAAAAAVAPPAGPVAVPAPAPAVPEMTKPWWETEQGEIGERMRRRR
jgi:putative copper resistance protein D